MSKYKITGSHKSESIPDILMELATVGACSRPTEYEVTNTDTGKVSHVLAENETQLGETIARGNLRD